jgi:quercetin dioxygenase-like cupin family protein
VTLPLSVLQLQTATYREAALRQRDAAVSKAWQRLAPRLSRSAEQARRHVTVRAADMPGGPGSDGVTTRTAYQVDAAAAVAPGEPTRIRLIEAPAGAWVVVPIDADADSAWLVLDGQIDIGGVFCGKYDYQERRAGESSVKLVTTHGARIMLRESAPSPRYVGGVGAVNTTRAGQMEWEELADGVSRRLLAPPQGSAAAYFVQLAAGAAAPAHRHGHAEECLVLEGEMYLDDILLFRGDFQLAHAGGQHHEASSESGVLLLVHGDLDLDVIDTEQR